MGTAASVDADASYRRLAEIYDDVVVDPAHGQWAAFAHEWFVRDRRGVRDVLDVCCGTGLMAAALSALGYRVVGVDASVTMLERARVRLGPDAVLLPATLPDLPVDAVFDAAVCTFDGLNYLTPADLVTSVAAVGVRLRPGGWFVFDLHTDAMMAFTQAHPTVHGEESGHAFRVESAVDPDARTCDTRIRVRRTHDGDTFAEVHRQYFFTDRQVAAAAAAGGFDVVAVTDEYTSAPLAADSLRATWVLRRGADRRPAGESAHE